MNLMLLNELVNSDGTRIGGDKVKLSRDNSKSASNSTLDPMYDEDGNQIKNASVQSTRQQGYRGYYSLVPMPAVKTPNATINTYTTNIDYMDDKKTKKKVKKLSKKKMEEMVEDIVSKKISKDVMGDVKKYGVINKNGIPDIEIISDENPLLVRKVKNLIDIVKKNQANGEQKGVILNFLINNIDTMDIPVEYKKEMLKKLQ